MTVYGGERVWCKVANVKYDGMIVMCQGMSLFFGRLFVIRFALCYRPLLCPVCDIGVLWPNGWMDQNETWHGGRPRPRPHCVRWGPSSLPKRGTAPNFRPVRQATVLDGDPAPPHKKGGTAPTQFSAHVYCGQMVTHLSYYWAPVYNDGHVYCVLWQFT